jgi:nicotinamide-nucleotide amidase
MKYTLFLIGEKVSSDVMLQRYIFRGLEAQGLKPDSLFKSTAADILRTALKIDAAEAHTVVLYCDPSQAPVVAREIATLLGDIVTTRGETLLPSDAVLSQPGYYTIEKCGLRLHAVTASSGNALPKPALQATGKSAFVHLFDVSRSRLAEVLKTVAETCLVRYTVIEPVAGWTECRLQAQRYGDVDRATQQLKSQFKTVIAAGNVALYLIETLAAAQKTVTFAESCTGGLLSYYLTKESGASGVFEGALVTYSNRLKSAWIAVENSTLEAHGAVSREVVEEMSAGAIDVAGADYAIAVSGVAGPTGGTPLKPVGTVEVAVRSRDGLSTRRLQLQGDRNYIQEQTVLHAVKMLMMLDQKTFFGIS